MRLDVVCFVVLCYILLSSVYFIISIRILPFSPRLWIVSTLEIVSNSRTKRNETKVTSFFPPSRYKIFFLRFKKKKKIITESSYKSHHRTNHFIRLESNFLLITIHFLLSAFENFKPGLNTYSRETEGKREQTIINKFPTIITLLHRDIQPNSLLRNLPLPPTLRSECRRERYIVTRAPTRILTFSPISVTKGAPRCLPLVSDSASGRAIAREFEIQINTERVHR